MYPSSFSATLHHIQSLPLCKALQRQVVNIGSTTRKVCVTCSIFLRLPIYQRIIIILIYEKEKPQAFNMPVQLFLLQTLATSYLKCKRHMPASCFMSLFIYRIYYLSLFRLLLFISRLLIYLHLIDNWFHFSILIRNFVQNMCIR